MAQSDSCKLFPIVARNSHCFYLQALYLQNNKIKQLPSSIGSFKNLQTLNVSGNNLKEIPTTLSQLDGLKNLDVSNNAKLVKLPKELGHLRSLRCVVFCCVCTKLNKVVWQMSLLLSSKSCYVKVEFNFLIRNNSLDTNENCGTKCHQVSDLFLHLVYLQLWLWEGWLASFTQKSRKF